MWTPLRACVTILLSAALLFSCSRTTRFFADSATLQELAKHRILLDTWNANSSLSQAAGSFVVEGHRIGEGDGLVLAYRRYSQPLLPAVDQETFEKLTVLLPSRRSILSETVPVGSDRDIVAFYARGSSAFPGRSGCFGYAKSGTVKLSGVSENRVRAEVELVFDLESPSGWPQDCGPFVFRRSLLLEHRAVQDLTPWEGTRARSLAEETHD